MPLGGYLSGTRMARDTAKISRHNQCGGPKKQGLAPQGAWMRQGMGNLKIVKSCKSRALNTNCLTRSSTPCRNPYTNTPTCKSYYYDPYLGKRVELKGCSVPTTKRPATSGGVGSIYRYRFR